MLCADDVLVRMDIHSTSGLLVVDTSDLTTAYHYLEDMRVRGVR
jgi:hypothetical protein